MVFINTTNAPALGSFIFRICRNLAPCPERTGESGSITDNFRASLPLCSRFFLNFPGQAEALAKADQRLNISTFRHFPVTAFFLNFIAAA
jgi:hypothetical protein